MSLVLHTAAMCGGQTDGWTGGQTGRQGHRGGTHVGELADSVGLHSDVVLLQLLLDLVNALRDVLGLGGRQ